jgi:hypothetical protein
VSLIGHAAAAEDAHSTYLHTFEAMFQQTAMHELMSFGM